MLFLGRLNWKKGLDRLIPAMQQVTNADLLIAGNDEENYRPELEALARRCGVVDASVSWVPLMGKKMGAARLRLEFWRLPSYSENFGNVVLEAMAVGCPVIVTPEVGMASVVQEAGCGVVADGDPANLGLEMKRLLDDHSRRRIWGKRPARGANQVQLEDDRQADARCVRRHFGRSGRKFAKRTGSNDSACCIVKSANSSQWDL